MINLRNNHGEIRFTPMKILRRIARSWLAIWKLVHFSLLSRFSVKKLTAVDTPVVVSLTSFGSRLTKVHLSIESIAQGSMKPGRIILWVDKEEYESALSLKRLRKLQDRGLEIREGVKRYRAHNKYYNFAASGDSGYLVTADDDVFYPKNWLLSLWAPFSETKFTEVVAHRVRNPKFIGGRIAPYNTWPIVSDCIPRIGAFTLGVSGVIFPDQVLRALASGGEDFMAVSPLADDVWISKVIFAQRVPVRQSAEKALSLIVTPFTQVEQLAEENVINGLNDAQILATYSDSDLLELQSLLR